MVVGSGMLARELRNYEWPTNCVVLAFGVSNSGESNVEEFERERLRVKSYLEDERVETVVYFSSSNIYHNKETPYSRHKISVEQEIVSSGKLFHIFRLPQVVGDVVNNTLVSFLVQKISSNDVVTVYRGAVRNLIGVDDVSYLVSDIVSNRVCTSTIQDIVSCRSITAEAIALEIASVLQREVKIQHLEGGEAINMSLEFLQKYYPKHKVVNDEAYWRSVLRRYVPLIADRLKQ